jgi:hypothetical protein
MDHEEECEEFLGKLALAAKNSDSFRLVKFSPGILADSFRRW